MVLDTVLERKHPKSIPPMFGQNCLSGLKEVSGAEVTEGHRGYPPAQLSDLSDMKFTEQCFIEICCICFKATKLQKCLQHVLYILAVPSLLDLASYFILFGSEYFFLCLNLRLPMFRF